MSRVLAGGHLAQGTDAGLAHAEGAVELGQALDRLGAIAPSAMLRIDAELHEALARMRRGDWRWAVARGALRRRSGIDPERIWLFGSQARGSATRSSDVDLAFEVPAGARARWARFVADTEESLPALADLDLVDIDRCGPELAEGDSANGAADLRACAAAR